MLPTNCLCVRPASGSLLLLVTLASPVCVVKAGVKLLGPLLAVLHCKMQQSLLGPKHALSSNSSMYLKVSAPLPLILVDYHEGVRGWLVLVQGPLCVAAAAALTWSLGTMLGAGGTEPSCIATAASPARNRLPPLPAPCSAHDALFHSARPG